MAKCPTCKNEIKNPKKTWKYAQFIVEAYSCDCGTEFREYLQNGKRIFTLRRLPRGKGFAKV